MSACENFRFPEVLVVRAAPDPQTLKRKIGGYSRQGNSSAATAARLELAEANLAAYIERTIATMPTLTADARTRLAVLLLSSPPSDAA